MKNYIGISRDHSGSMATIKRAATRDYNSTIASIKDNSEKENQDTIVSVIKCGTGYHAQNVFESVNSTVAKLQPLNESDYDTVGGATPLWDSVLELIKTLESVPDAKDPTVSFLVMAITDGGDNSSRWSSAVELTRKIEELQRTDRWTFVFRVPRGYASQITRIGIPDGNILEWEQTNRGVEMATAATSQAFDGYFKARSAGARSTKGFYTTNLNTVDKKEVKKALQDITTQVEFFPVTAKDNKAQIRAFVESKIKGTMARGGAFYQFTKKEDEIQDYKIIAVRDKRTKKVYSGTEARNILGLPETGTVKVAPGNHGEFDIFIQSTSVNRSLVGGTEVMYWANVGTPYQK